ncbi:MAG: hypothetical protein LBE31_02725 [Deltaproteobacteria bacterium]|nr:hypothetical protein [Deltaproteobacteria bacterium]
MLKRKMYRLDKPDKLFSFIILTVLSLIAGLASMWGAKYLSVLIGNALLKNILLFLAWASSSILLTFFLIFAAVVSVTLYCLIRYPLWLSQNVSLAVWAVGRIKNQEKLLEIALNHFARLEARMEAIKKLSHQPLLVSLAQAASLSSDLILLAAEQLTDQNDLAEIAKSAQLKDARNYALEKIDDRKILEKVFHKASDIDIKIRAANKMDNQTIASSRLLELARSRSCCPFDRLKIGKFLKNNLLIKRACLELAINNPEIDDAELPEILAALKSLNDQKALLVIATRSQNPAIWIATIKLLDGDFLLKIASNGVGYQKYSHAKVDPTIIEAKPFLGKKRLACQLLGHVWLPVNFGDDKKICDRCGHQECNHSWVTKGGCGSSECPRGGVEDWVMCGGSYCPGESPYTLCEKCGLLQ